MEFPQPVLDLDMNIIVNLAKDRMVRRANKRKRLHDKKHVNTTILQIGDKVLLKTLYLSSALKKETKKFFDLYVGPYIVQAVVAPNAYLLKDEQNVEKGIHNIVNLKLYYALRH